MLFQAVKVPDQPPQARRCRLSKTNCQHSKLISNKGTSNSKVMELLVGGDWLVSGELQLLQPAIWAAAVISCSFSCSWSYYDQH